MDDYSDMDEAIYDGLTAMMVGVMHGDHIALELVKEWMEVRTDLLNKKISAVMCQVKCNDIQLKAREKLAHLLA